MNLQINFFWGGLTVISSTFSCHSSAGVGVLLYDIASAARLLIFDVVVILLAVFILSLFVNQHT